MKIQFKLIDEYADEEDQLVAICWAENETEANQIFDDFLNKDLTPDDDDYWDLSLMQIEHSEIIVIGGKDK